MEFEFYTKTKSWIICSGNASIEYHNGERHRHNDELWWAARWEIGQKFRGGVSSWDESGETCAAENCPERGKLSAHSPCHVKHIYLYLCFGFFSLNKLPKSKPKQLQPSCRPTNSNCIRVAKLLFYLFPNSLISYSCLVLSRNHFSSLTFFLRN